LSTKIHATADAPGNPTAFYLTPGQASDLEGADALLADTPAQTVIADKAFDADERVIEPLRAAQRQDCPQLPGCHSSCSCRRLAQLMTRPYGLAAPKDTPQEVAEVLPRAVHAALRDSELLKVFRADGASEVHRAGQAFTKLILRDLARWCWHVRAVLERQ